MRELPLQKNARASPILQNVPPQKKNTAPVPFPRPAASDQSKKRHPYSQTSTEKPAPDHNKKGEASEDVQPTSFNPRLPGGHFLLSTLKPRLPGGHSCSLVSSETQGKGSHVASPEDVLVSPRARPQLPIEGTPDPSEGLEFQPTSIKPRLPGGHSRLSPIFGPRLPGGHSRFLVSSETQDTGSHVASPEDSLVSLRAHPQLTIEGTPDPSGDSNLASPEDILVSGILRPCRPNDVCKSSVECFMWSGSVRHSRRTTPAAPHLSDPAPKQDNTP